MRIMFDVDRGEITILLSADADGDVINRHYKQGLSLELNPSDYYELLMYQGLSKKTIEAFASRRRL